MVIDSETRLPYVVPEIFEIELQDKIDFWESEVSWAQHHLDAARIFAQQIRERKAARENLIEPKPIAP